MPKVSIILPTYNSAGTITGAILSILNQSFRDLELIIIDDGSGDQTVDLIKGLVADDQRIKLFLNDRNHGVSYSRNRGIAQSSGEYLAFQDSGDVWLRDKLKIQIEIMDNLPKEYGVIYSGLWRVRGQKRKLLCGNLSSKYSGDIYRLLLKDNWIDLPTVLIRREYIENFDEELIQLEDWDLLIQLAKKYLFYYINEPLTESYYKRVSLSANKTTLLQALLKILDKNFTDISRDKSILSWYFYRFALANLATGNIKQAREYLKKSFLLYPLGFHSIFTYIIVLFGDSFSYKLISRVRKLIIGHFFD